MTNLSRGLRNNNPGNIRINSDNFLGEVKPSQDSAFKQFKTMDYGYRAIFVILTNYINKYGANTIAKIITRWAPPNENNTQAYINTVAARSGINANTLLDMNSGEELIKIVAEISFVENGVPAVMADVQAGFDLQQSIKKKS